MLSSDCRFGAVAVNGVLVRAPVGGWFLTGEVTWHFCSDGFEYRGHSVEVLAQGWYDTTFQGQRTCGVYTPVAVVPTDCGLGPPYLPVLL